MVVGASIHQCSEPGSEEEGAECFAFARGVGWLSKMGNKKEQTPKGFVSERYLPILEVGIKFNATQSRHYEKRSDEVISKKIA